MFCKSPTSPVSGSEVVGSGSDWLGAGWLTVGSGVGVGLGWFVVSVFITNLIIPCFAVKIEAIQG